MGLPEGLYTDLTALEWFDEHALNNQHSAMIVAVNRVYFVNNEVLNMNDIYPLGCII
jgi:hypothetical protein